MRNNDDYITVKFQAIGSVQVDLERLPQDPIWQRIAAQLPIDPEDLSSLSDEGLNAAISEYVRVYLSQNELLNNMPTTNGPANIYGGIAEVVKRRPCPPQNLPQ